LQRYQCPNTLANRYPSLLEWALARRGLTVVVALPSKPFTGLG
jgi:hypothetical protein